MELVMWRSNRNNNPVLGKLSDINEKGDGTQILFNLHSMQYKRRYLKVQFTQKLS